MKEKEKWKKMKEKMTKNKYSPEPHLGVEVGRQAVLCVVRHLDRLLIVLELEEGHGGAEGLLPIDLHAGRCIPHHRGLEKVALVIRSRKLRGSRASNHDPGALCDCIVHMLLYL